MMKPRVGIYPGTFDPITNGHTDIIRRAVRVVDRLIIGVARNDGKGPLFATDERVEIVREEVAHLDGEEAARIEVRAFDTLLVHFAEAVGASVIVRGLRAVSDFEYEFQMAGMNARLNPEIETVFLMASDRYQFISSRFVKEIGALGGDVSHFVSPRVAAPRRALCAAARPPPSPRRRLIPAQARLARRHRARPREGRERLAGARRADPAAASQPRSPAAASVAAAARAATRCAAVPASAARHASSISRARRLSSRAPKLPEQPARLCASRPSAARSPPAARASIAAICPSIWSRNA